jgi:protein-S-isoprenylcysteine O-methyltransferase Ste14
VLYVSAWRQRQAGRSATHSAVKDHAASKRRQYGFVGRLSQNRHPMNTSNWIYFLWLLSEIILNRRLRSGKSAKQSSDKNTLLLLWVSIFISITIGVFVSKTTYFPIDISERLPSIGLTVIIMGITIRLVAIKQLGQFFTVDVTIRENHQLLQNGLYKLVRHPSYTGSLLSFLGLGLSLNNWLSLSIVLLPTLSTFIYRMNIEEKVLIEQFGKQYLDYMAKTKRLIPFMY